jgi:hypothetical protein
MANIKLKRGKWMVFPNNFAFCILPFSLCREIQGFIFQRQIGALNQSANFSLPQVVPTDPDPNTETIF